MTTLNPAFNLPVLPFPPANMPGWMEYTAQTTQFNYDNDYKGELSHYLDNQPNFLQTQALKRGSNRNYRADDYPFAIPVRKIVVFDTDGNMGSRTADPDPNIHPPVLADLPPEDTGQPWVTHPPTDPEEVFKQIQQMFGQGMYALMQKQAALSDKLDAILKAVSH